MSLLRNTCLNHSFLTAIDPALSFITPTTDNCWFSSPSSMPSQLAAVCWFPETWLSSCHNPALPPTLHLNLIHILWVTWGFQSTPVLISHCVLCKSFPTLLYSKALQNLALNFPLSSNTNLQVLSSCFFKSTERWHFYQLLFFFPEYPTFLDWLYLPIIYLYWPIILKILPFTYNFILVC